MKKRIVLIISLIFLIGALLYSSNGFKNPTTVLAVGDLVVSWGVPDGDPIFVVNNMAPGDMEQRVVNVTNNAPTGRPVGVRGVKTSETGGLSTVLDFVISEGGTDLYGGTSPTGSKTLADFFTDSLDPDGIPLSTLGPSASTNYTFKATFQSSAGNAFQDAQVIFNIIIGISVDVPEECEEAGFTGFPIFGTSGNDRINGTSGNDLIFGLEGNDRIFGHGGDDCIVGGEGNDELRGETGDDFIFGQEGNDLLIGAVGKDLIRGGEGADTIRGENNEDQLFGEEGNDKITGGNSDDQISGGEGNDDISAENGEDEVNGDSGIDKLDGGAGNDLIHGDEDNDTINGKSGNDTLFGDLGTDSINGSSGTDTCDGEVEINCEI